MAAKAILVLCAQALLVQFSFSQCVGPIVGAYDGLARGLGCAPFTPTASVGGSFVVTSASPVAPTGVKVVSENVYEGALAVGGNLPLLGSVGVEGEFCTAGAGAVSYGCGDDAVAIVAEDGPIVTGIVDPLIAGPGYGLGAGYGLGTGCGFGAGYGFLPGFGFASGYGGATPFGYGYGLGYGTGYGFGYGLGGYGPGYGCGCGAIY